MEEIKSSDFRFDENQKIKIYQFMMKTESLIEDDHLKSILDQWRKIIQNAQQRNQCRDLFNHKIVPELQKLECVEEKLKRRFEHLRKLTVALWE